MDNKYIYLKAERDKEFVIASMRKYVTEKQELDKKLEELITPFIKGKSMKILDACCGIGHIPYFLSDISPKSSFLGIDINQFLIAEAKKLCKNNPNIQFEVGDIFNPPAKFNKYFDISINWKTASWLPYYDDLLKSLINVTKNHIFLSSLFYNGDIDFEIKVREYKKNAGKDGFNGYYNVYSFPHFKEFVYDLGAKNVESYDFEINKDIPKPPVDQMGTYTVKLDEGGRLQISGCVIMMWKIIRIDM